MKQLKFLLSVAMFFIACVFTSCNDDNMEFTTESSNRIDSLKVETRSVGSGIDLHPDNTWSTVSSSGSNNKIRIFKQGSSTYVIAVDLSTGAKVVPYYEFASGNTNASINNPDPRFKKNEVGVFNLSSLQWYAVTNLGFFGDRSDASGNYTYANDHASFLLKKNGTIVSCGYGTYSSGEPKRRTLAIVGSAAAVVDGPGNFSSCVPGYNSERNTAWKTELYNKVKSNFNSLDNVLVGLHPESPKNPSSPIGRTFVGVRQKTPLTNGGPVYIYILVGSSLTQSKAYQILQDFGCDKSEIIMFDGSHSSQMKSITSGVSLPSTGSREVPLWLVVKQN